MTRFAWTIPYWFFSMAIGTYTLGKFGAAASSSFAEVWPFLVNYVDFHRVALIVHMIFGPLALLLAPFQFWTKLRNSRPRIHRFLGYSYVVSIMLAGVTVAVMMGNFAGTAWAATGFLLLDAGWMATTIIAVNKARQKNFSEHRRWMIRSATLTFAAVTLRLQMIPLIIAGLSILETYNYTAWLSWLLPLVVVELWLRFGQGKRRSLARPAESSV